MFKPFSLDFYHLSHPHWETINRIVNLTLGKFLPWFVVSSDRHPGSSDDTRSSLRLTKYHNQADLGRAVGTGWWTVVWLQQFGDSSWCESRVDVKRERLSTQMLLKVLECYYSNPLIPTNTHWKNNKGSFSSTLVNKTGEKCPLGVIIKEIVAQYDD